MGSRCAVCAPAPQGDEYQVGRRDLKHPLADGGLEGRGLKGGDSSLSRTLPKRAPPQEPSLVRVTYPGRRRGAKAEWHLLGCQVWQQQRAPEVASGSTLLCLTHTHTDAHTGSTLLCLTRTHTHTHTLNISLSLSLSGRPGKALPPRVTCIFTGPRHSLALRSHPYRASVSLSAH